MTIIDWELDGLDAEMYPKHLNSIPNNRAFKYEIKDDAKYKPIKITDITNIKKNFTIDNIFSDIVFDDNDGSKYKFVVKFNPIRLYKNTLKNLTALEFGKILVISGISLQQNVCINWTHILQMFGKDIHITFQTQMASNLMIFWDYIEPQNK